jgi:hypothetical protein
MGQKMVSSDRARLVLRIIGRALRGLVAHVGASLASSLSQVSAHGQTEVEASEDSRFFSGRRPGARMPPWTHQHPSFFLFQLDLVGTGPLVPARKGL